MWNFLHMAQAGRNQMFHTFNKETTAKTTDPEARDMDAHGQPRCTLRNDIVLPSQSKENTICATWILKSHVHVTIHLDYSLRS